MKRRIGHLLIALFISLVATPAFGGTYDANGQWDITLDIDQKISIGNYEYTLPMIPISATIGESEDGTRFDLETLPIDGLQDIIYQGEGDIIGSKYVFDEAVIASVDIGELTRISVLSGKTADVSLAGFELTSDNILFGQFEFSSDDVTNLNGNVSFSGTKEAVPLPAAAWLLGSGMVGLIGLKRRAKA